MKIPYFLEAFPFQELWSVKHSGTHLYPGTQRAEVWRIPTSSSNWLRLQDPVTKGKNNIDESSTNEEFEIHPSDGIFPHLHLYHPHSFHRDLNSPAPSLNSRDPPASASPALGGIKGGDITPGSWPPKLTSFSAVWSQALAAQVLSV